MHSFPKGPYVDAKGLPTNFNTEIWPHLEHEPLEAVIAYRSQAIVKFISEYTVPIYHISFEWEDDMEYGCNGDRTPVSYINHMYIWTFYKEHPIIHVYSAYKEKSVGYKYSISPFISEETKMYDERLNEWWDEGYAIWMSDLQTSRPSS